MRNCFVDTNNRFPYPKTNNWCILASFNHNLGKFFIEGYSLETLIEAHKANPEAVEFIESYISTCERVRNLVYNIFDFVKFVCPKQPALIHYGGSDD